MEDGDRPEVLLAEPRRELLGQRDRAVVAAGAAHRDREARLALAEVSGQGEREELVEVAEELPGDRLVEDERANLLREARQGAEPFDVIRVLHESDIEDQVGLERYPELEAEADELDREATRVGRLAEAGEDPLPQLAQREVRGVDHDIGLRPGRVEEAALRLGRARDSALVGQ